MVYRSSFPLLENTFISLIRLDLFFKKRRQSGHSIPPSPAAPLVHQPVDPDLEELVVPDGPVRHDDAVVELVEGAATLRRAAVVAQLDQLAAAVVEAQAAGAEGGTGGPGGPRGSGGGAGLGGGAGGGAWNRERI